MCILVIVHVDDRTKKGCRFYEEEKKNAEKFIGTVEICNFCR